MAAKSVMVSFHTIGSEHPKLELEPRWWPADELCDHPQFVQSNETGSYYDWDGAFTEAEFRTLHEQYRHLATEGIYANADWQKVILPQMQVIDAALAGGVGTLTKVHVRVFEWESGLGD